MRKDQLGDKNKFLGILNMVIEVVNLIQSWKQNKTNIQESRNKCKRWIT